MKVNVGSTDRIIRIIVGIAIILIGFLYESWWGIIGLVVLLTGILKVCPAYMPFGISTCKTETKTEN